jgi:RAD54-like protein 2
VIQEWSKGGGVLLIGYELYRQLSLKRPNKTNSKKKRRKPQDEVVDVDEDDKNKAMLEG